MGALEIDAIVAGLRPEAEAWCEAMASSTLASVNRRPHVRVLEQQDDVVRAELGFQLWTNVQSGSGSGEYYVRIVDVRAGGATLVAEMCLPVTEWEDEYGNPEQAIEAFRARVAEKHPLRPVTG